MGPSEVIPRRHSFWKRRNLFGVRNRDFLLIFLVALVCGVAVTLVTAYLGVQ